LKPRASKIKPCDARVTTPSQTRKYYFTAHDHLLRFHSRPSVLTISGVPKRRGIKKKGPAPYPNIKIASKGPTEATRRLMPSYNRLPIPPGGCQTRRSAIPR